MPPARNTLPSIVTPQRLCRGVGMGASGRQTFSTGSYSSFCAQAVQAVAHGPAPPKTWILVLLFPLASRNRRERMGARTRHVRVEGLYTSVVSRTLSLRPEMA